MKPENLKLPFQWNERKILVDDRIWYVPSYHDKYGEFNFPGWSAPEFFGNGNPVMIEYCSGNGAWLAAKAAANPLVNWVGIEKKVARVRKIWSKIKNLQLNNLIVICGEGSNATKRYLHDSSVKDIYINFPDPWPKTRHAKHRLMQPAFVEDMWRILNDSGTLTFVTDDPDYSAEVIRVLHRHKGFISKFSEPYYITDWEEYGTSYFERLWRDKGKIIRYHQFCKRQKSA